MLRSAAPLLILRGAGLELSLVVSLPKRSAAPLALASECQPEKQILHPLSHQENLAQSHA